ncbi:MULTISPECIES: hypothetical protein [Xanthomonas]|uniref:hypothetical protein n=1 Tax=Xanthomonas TaxID=338 RepID=UPI001BAE86F2|nr:MULTISPECIES: hypothetical protein [Xanthomonas]MCP3043090.1 hypothetical protein [Xanthomonas euvesicatoria pv. allii]QUI81688.1 hypothetical protein ICA18_05235 [Xanthomonas arboricola pv. corylina]
MKKFVWRCLIAAASVGSLLSGFFWFLSARMQRQIMEAAVSNQKSVQDLLLLSADMNYWAALGAFCTGIALVLSALFED